MKKVILSFVLAAVLVSSFAAAETTTIRPDGQGDWDGWKNNGCDKTTEWQCVDEATADTSDYLETTTSKKESFTFGDTSLTSETINSVTLYYYAKENNNQNHICFEALVREDSTDYLGGTTFCGNETWQYFSHEYTTNPATGSAWTVSEVDALEAGMAGKKGDAGAEISQVYAVVDYDSADTCSDSDGGDEPFTFGYVSGEESGSPFNNSDVCINSTFLTEWTCSGDAPVSSAVDCDALTIFPAICFNGFCIETS